MSKPRKVLTLEERVRVVELGKSKSARKIAEELGVGKTQIQSILKRKAEVLSDYESNVPCDRKRVRRTTGNEEINDLVLEWFKDASRRRAPVTGPLIQQQAMKFARDLQVESFQASSGWLTSFKKRNNIVFGSMSGERGDVNPEVVGDWKEKLPTVCAGYSSSDIFNMDETGLFFRDTTRKSFHFKGEDLAGGKRSKERLTIALCASMEGEKLKPLVIGKSAHPRCFSKIRPEKLPVMYRHNKRAWMDSAIMTEWLRSVDKQMRKQNRNILLFLDNASVHPTTLNLTNVKLVFLPANTTSLTQPMDQGIIQAMKLKYRKRQLQYILSQMEQNDKMGSDILRSITVLDAIYWVPGSWKEVDISTVQKCFDKGEFDKVRTVTAGTAEDSSDLSDHDDDEVPLAALRMSMELFGCDFHELLEIDRNLATSDNFGLDWEKDANELLEEMRQCDNCDDDDDNEHGTYPPTESCSVTEAQHCVERLKCFALEKGQNAVLDAVMNLQGLLTVCTSDVHAKLTKISDFFSKN